MRLNLSNKYPKVFRRFFASVQAKIVLGTTLIVAIAIGVSTYFAIQFQERQLLESTRRKIHMVTGTIVRSITFAMEAGRATEVQRTLELIGSYPNYVELRIFNPQGIVLKASDSTRVGTRVFRGEFPTEERTFVLFEDRQQHPNIITARRAILNESKCHRCHGNEAKINGILEVSVSLSTTEAQIALSRKLLFGNALVTFLVMSTTLSLLFSLLVGRPVEQLSNTMAKVEAGDLDVQVSFKRQDEIGSLGRSFNAMVRRLADTLRQIEQHHRNEMQRADRLATLGELAAGIAHEVRNPLAGISGAVQVLANELKNNDPHREVMQEIQKEIERLDNSLKTFLDYARPAKPEFQLVNVHDVIERTLTLCQRSGQCAHIELIREFQSNLPKLRMDPILMEQVFMNIVINALQAMGDGGRLTVTTRQTCDSVLPGKVIEIAFSDTGQGIPSQDLEKIFRPFFSTKHQGTGLGLTNALRIVEQHQGTITVESEVGKGTCFRVVLPLTNSQLK
ncbi:MAG: ATP-binding protein [bacterium]